MEYNNLKKISGQIHRGHDRMFIELIQEFDDVVWSGTNMTIYKYTDRMDFETGVLGYKYQRQREFVERLNGISDITESEYGILENKTVKFK